VTFEEAKKVLLEEEAERDRRYEEERQERIAAGTPTQLDTLFMPLDRKTHWYDALTGFWWRLRRFSGEQVWRRRWYYSLKNRWLRSKRGWGQQDWWNLDHYIVSWLPSALRHLAKNEHGYPIDIYDENGKSMVYAEDGEHLSEAFLAHNQNLLGIDWRDEDCRVHAPHENAMDALWQETLERMAIGFESWELLAEHGWLHCDSEAEQELDRMRDEGMKLFINNFGSLWD
jgi:hypothetical protein